MRIMLTLAPDDLDVLRRRVADCERAGLTALGIGDSPGYHDVYVALTVAAQHSSRLRLGPMVTNLVTRAPQVTARALRSLGELAPGRIFAGIGTGDSALAGAGMRPLNVDGMRTRLADLLHHWPVTEPGGTSQDHRRADGAHDWETGEKDVSATPREQRRAEVSTYTLLGGETAEQVASCAQGRMAVDVDGLATLPLGGETAGREVCDTRPEGWRIVLTANGPRTLALGGEAADLVVSGTGLEPGAVGRALAAVRDGEQRAGRPAGSVELWTVARIAVDDDADRARDQLLPLLASGANHVFAVPAEMRALPEPVAAKVRELRAAYDYGAHGLPGPANPNARLVDRLGLRDVLAERFALAGPPERVAAGLRELAGLGVGGVVVPAVGLDPDALIRRLGEEVLPMLAARPRP